MNNNINISSGSSSTTSSSRTNTKEESILLCKNQYCVNTEFRYGDMAFVEERYDDAIQHYSNAISMFLHTSETVVLQQQQQQQQSVPVVGVGVVVSSNHNGSLTTCDDSFHLQFQCYLHRSIAYYQIQQYELAHVDSAKALQQLPQIAVHKDNSDTNNNNNSNHPSLFTNQEIHLCYRHYGIVAYQIQKFSMARTIFTKIIQEQLYTTTTTTTTYNNASTLVSSKYNELYYQNYIHQCHVQIEKEQQQQQQQRQQQLLQGNESMPMDETTTTTATVHENYITPATGSIVAIEPSASISTSCTTATNLAITTKLNPVTLLSLTPKYQYYQNDTQMTIQILESNVIPSNMTVQYIDTQTIVVSIRKMGHDIILIQGLLYDTIVPNKCTISYRTDKVIIKLRKERPNYEWQTLLSESNRKGDKKSSTTAMTAKPKTTCDSSTDTNLSTTTPTGESNVVGTDRSNLGSKIPKPYASHRDWDAIGKDVEEEIANDKSVGDEAMNQLFQQIYANANDDTKRAMIKSYQTSGGTVLSTNWDEVARKDYENEDRIAPDGQEWKTWEGKQLSNNKKN